MLTGEIRSQIDQIWNAFWTGGISKPLQVIEQITCLLFLRRLDEIQTVEEAKAARLGRPAERILPMVRAWFEMACGFTLVRGRAVIGRCGSHGSCRSLPGIPAELF